MVGRNLIPSMRSASSLISIRALTRFSKNYVLMNFKARDSMILSAN